MIIHKIRNFKDFTFLKLYNVKNLLIFEIVRVGEFFEFSKLQIFLNFPNLKFVHFPKMQVYRNCPNLTNF